MTDSLPNAWLVEGADIERELDDIGCWAWRGGDEERSDFNFQKLSKYRQQDNVSIDIKWKW